MPQIIAAYLYSRQPQLIVYLVFLKFLDCPLLFYIITLLPFKDNMSLDINKISQSSNSNLLETTLEVFQPT